MRTLREGDTGAIVELLQWGLARAGQGIAADGIFGALTVQALQRWQEKNGLAADGIAGPGIWDSLRPYLNGQAVPRLSVVPADIQWSSDLLAFVVEGLLLRYPFLELGVIGKSVLGRPLYRLRIGRGAVRVGYNAAHHANEWITTPVLLRFLEEYARGIAVGSGVGGADFRNLYENYTLDIVPMVNPDGVDLVTRALDPASASWLQARSIAVAFPDIPFPSGWKANIDGTDLNLSYPAGWETAKRLKYAQGFNRPAPRDFVGPAPLSAPEAAAMAAYTKQAGYRLILAYHTQGKIIFWKYAGYNPAGSYALARRMAGVSGYSVETTPDFSGNAGYKDWFIQEFNRPGYTIEAGEGVSPLPLGQFEEIYRDNFGILLLGMVGLDG